jgi:proteasome accessory factor C
MIEQQKILKVFRLIRRLSIGLPSKWDILAQELDVSKSTIYKYISLLKELGYNVIKDAEGRHKIEGLEKNYQSLNPKEKSYLKTLVTSTSRKTSLQHSILSKLETSSNFNSPKVSQLLNRVIIIERVIAALEAKMPITLVDYRSTSTNSDLSRNIFPIFLDENKLALLGYEYETEKFKTYKLQRVSSIEPYEIEQKKPFADKTIPTLDAFGFTGVKKLKIELQLTKRASALLQEEFDVAEETIISTRDPNYPFRYKDMVSDYTGIGRFILGMCTEVKVVKDEELKKYLKEKLNNQTIF